MSWYAKRKRSQKNAIMVPLASMGDIAFLLIIFFMVCSNFAKEAQVDVEQPRSLEIEIIENSMISVALDKDGKIYLNGTEVPDSDAVEYGVAALIKGKEAVEARTVMFKCDRNVDRQAYEPVLDSIAAAGGVIAAVGEQAPSN